MEINLDFNKYWDWPELAKAFHDPRQYVTIDANRGSGKTAGAFIWLLEEMFTTDANLGLWVDVIQANIDSYVEIYLQHWFLKDLWAYCHYDRQRHRLTLPGGKIIQFVSAEKPENAEGFRYHRIVVNEGGLVLKRARLWDSTLEPMTHPRDGIGNKTRLVGTMKGKNRFHQLTCMADEDWGSHHFDIYTCPRFTKEEADKIKVSKPDIEWRQEWMSEAIDGSGAVFREIYRCVHSEIYDKAKPNKQYIMAVDLAKHQDFTVITVGELQSAKMVFMDRFNQIDWNFQKERIHGIWKRFNKPKIVIDATGAGDPIYDDLLNAGMQVEGYKFTNTSKNQLIRGLSVAIDNQEIKIANYPVLINELEIFELNMTPSGAITYSAPSGMHDDTVISLALFNYLVQNKVEVRISWI
jgi:hypothetical protein